MDSVTQATLGAAIGQAVLGKKIGAKGALFGAIVATIPDLDVVLFPFYDQLLRISIHRGYSHSIFATTIIAFILVYLFSKWKWTSAIEKKTLFIFSWLCLFTHLILDVFTSYGTQIFLPFSDERVSLDSINIVDPIYTIPLFTGLILSLILKSYKKKALLNTIGLTLSSCYLLFTLVIKQQTNTEFNEQLNTQNISYDELLTVPVKVGGINWYGAAKTQEHLYIGKYSHFNKNAISFEKFSINDHLLDHTDPNMADRLKWFSKGFYTVVEHNGKTRLYNMQCDMQGIRTFGEYKAPTAFYFEIETDAEGNYTLTSGMHQDETLP